MIGNKNEAYIKRHQASERRRKLWKMYRLRMPEYEALVAKHNGRCGICQCKRPLFVDHCHLTMTVRGLLCQRCNSGLGMFKDNLRYLQGAIKYLQTAPGPALLCGPAILNEIAE